MLTGPKSSLLTDIQDKVLITVPTWGTLSKLLKCMQNICLLWSHFLLKYWISPSFNCVLETLPFLRSAPKCKNLKCYNDQCWCFQNVLFDQKQYFPVVLISPKLHFLVTDLFANKILPCSGHWLIVVKFWHAYIVNVLHMSLLDFFSRRSHWILENIIKLSALSVGQVNKGLNKSHRACLLFMMIG